VSGGGQQRFGFLAGEVGHHRPGEPLRRDGEHPGDLLGVLGVLQGREAEQRVDRGQPGVAAARAVAPLAFEVVQERGHQRCVEILDPEPGGRRAGVLLSEDQEQPQRVAVGGDGVRAGVLLPGEPVGEERLQGGGQRGHDIAAEPDSSRSATSASSSGAADRYQ
jgi:hypothetical protein